MIAYNGELSSECRAYLIKRQRKLTTLLAVCIGVLCSIPFIIIAFLYNWVFILFSLIIILLPVFQFFSFKGATLNYILPYKFIIIDGKMTCVGAKFREEREIGQVSKVLDFGNWYHIFFKFPYKSQNFVAQKDLLTEGSLEEFENLFRGKLIKVRNKEM